MAFNKNVPKEAVKAFSNNEINLMSLMTTAMDLHPKLYDFMQWINAPGIID